MPPAKTPATRTRRTKAEVQADFTRLESQNETRKSDTDAKSEELGRQREAEVRETVAELTTEAIVQKIGQLGIEVSRHLSDVSARLTTGTLLLQSLREAVSLERREVERMHGIDTAQTSIDFLIEEYRQK